VNFGRIVRFGLVGVVNTLTYYGFYLLLGRVLPYFAAHVLAFVLSMIGSYFLSCYFTFRVKPSWKTFLLFPLSAASNFVITSVGLWLLVELLHVNETIAPLLAAAVAVPITFVVAQFIFHGKGGFSPVPAGESAEPQETVR
jgi:putative flippase GtrA